MYDKSKLKKFFKYFQKPSFSFYNTRIHNNIMWVGIYYVLWVPLSASMSFFLLMSVYFGDSGQKGNVTNMNIAGTMIKANSTGQSSAVPKM